MDMESIIRKIIYGTIKTMASLFWRISITIIGTFPSLVPLNLQGKTQSPRKEEAAYPSTEDVLSLGRLWVGCFRTADFGGQGGAAGPCMMPEVPHRVRFFQSRKLDR